MNKSSIITVYYSYSGNTREVAEIIHNKIGCMIFEIVPAIPYPTNYNEMIIQSQKEINTRYLPELKYTMTDIKKYDIILLGFPNWWGTIPPIVCSFLTKHNLTGKTIIPFITHGGGGEQMTVRNLIEFCPDCEIKNNAWIGYGNRTMGICGWLKDNNLI